MVEKWGEKITVNAEIGRLEDAKQSYLQEYWPDRKYLADLEQALRETRERMQEDLNRNLFGDNADPPQTHRIPDTWSHRLELAWEALCGRITWDDVR